MTQVRTTFTGTNLLAETFTKFWEGRILLYIVGGKLILQNT